MTKTMNLLVPIQKTENKSITFLVMLYLHRERETEREREYNKWWKRWRTVLATDNFSIPFPSPVLPIPPCSDLTESSQVPPGIESNFVV